MARDKAAKGKKPSTDMLSAAKSGGVTKSSKSAPAKAKMVAKDVASKAELIAKKKKTKKQPEPESASESEFEGSDSSDSKASESESESASAEEVAKPQKAVNGKAKSKPAANGVNKAKEDSSAEESDESDSESGSDADEKPKADASNDEDSGSDEGSEEESDSEVPTKAVKAKVAKVAKAAASNSDNSDSDADSEDEESDSSGSDESPAEAEAPSKKRKAAGDSAEVAEPIKKAKTETSSSPQSHTLFVGNLSWNVDGTWLADTFKDCEGFTDARVVTMNGRSKGFGYVDFATPEAAQAALEKMMETELDGRPMNLDISAPRTNDRNSNDRANQRARQHGDTVSPESDTLFVGNLPFTADEEMVSAHFSEVAPVKSLRLPTDMETGNRKGFGYVTFESIEDAKSAFNQLNGSFIGEGRSSRALRLDYAAQRSDSGGGRGGRGGGRGGGGRGRGGRGGGRGGASGFNRGGFGDFKGKKISF